MKLSQFKFKLPDEQIALYPHGYDREFKNDAGETEHYRIVRRDEARLMVLHRKSGQIDLFQNDADGNPVEGKYIEFRNIIDYFDEGDVFVFNDTKVFPARLYGTKEKTDAKIEVFLLRELNREMRLWDVLVEPARKIRIGNKLVVDDSGTMVAEVIGPLHGHTRTTWAVVGHGIVANSRALARLATRKLIPSVVRLSISILILHNPDNTRLRGAVK